MEDIEKKKIDWNNLKGKIDEVAKLITNLVILVQVPAIGLFLILINYLIRNGAMPPSGLDMFVSYLMLVLIVIFFFLFCLPALTVPVILKRISRWNPSEIELRKEKPRFDGIKVIKLLLNSYGKVGKLIFLIYLILLLILWTFLPLSPPFIIVAILSVSFLSILFSLDFIFTRLGLIVSINSHFFLFFILIYFILQPIKLYSAITAIIATLISLVIFLYLTALSAVALIRMTKDNYYTIVRDSAIAGVLLILSLVYIFNYTDYPIIRGILRMLNLASANEKVIYLDEKLKDLYGCGECVEVVWRSKEQIVLRKKENNKVWIVPWDKVSFENCQDNKSGGDK